MQGRRAEGSQTRGRPHKRGVGRATNILKSSYTWLGGCAVSMASSKGMRARHQSVTFLMVCADESGNLSVSDNAGSGAFTPGLWVYLYMETLRLTIQSKNMILNDS